MWQRLTKAIRSRRVPASVTLREVGSRDGLRGNVSTQEIASLLARRGFTTGVEVSRLRESDAFVRRQPDAQRLFGALSQRCMPDHSPQE